MTIQLNGINDIFYWTLSGFAAVWPSILISLFIPRKNYYWIRLGSFILIFTASMTAIELNGIVYYNTWWGKYILEIISFFVFLFVSRCRIIEMCYLGVWSLAFQNLMSQLPGLIATTILNGFSMSNMFLLKLISLLIISATLLFFTKFCIAGRFQDVIWWEFVETFIITEAVIRFNDFIFRQNENSITGLHGSMIFILQTFSAVCVILVLFMQSEIHYRRKMQLENAMKERLWSLERKQFEERSEQIDLINRKCHDLKHQIAALEFISDKQIYKQTIQELKEAVSLYDDGLHTENLALETILKEKNCSLIRKKPLLNV